jgi:hypothetical protein
LTQSEQDALFDAGLPESTVVDISKKKRDRAAEMRSATLALAERIAQVRESRESGLFRETWQVAQSLILCGLPYDEQGEQTQWARRARLADGSQLKVTFVAAVEGVPLPYGQDRGPLYFMVDRAVARYHELETQLNANPKYRLHDQLSSEELETRVEKRMKILDQARFVEWDTATEYLSVIGLSAGGRAYNVLKQRLKRLRSCSISVVRLAPNGDEETLVLPMVRASRMPGWAKDHSISVEAQPKQLALDGKDEEEFSLTAATVGDSQFCGFEMGHDFFHDFCKYHVPVPVPVIKAFLSTPKLLDLVAWLSWRVYAARTMTFIPLSEIRQQIGTSDKNDARLMASLRSVIKVANEVGWSELRAEVISGQRGRQPRRGRSEAKGLRLGPPAGGVQFAPETEKNKKRIQVDPTIGNDRKPAQKVLKAASGDSPE